MEDVHLGRSSLDTPALTRRSFLRCLGATVGLAAFTDLATAPPVDAQSEADIDIDLSKNDPIDDSTATHNNEKPADAPNVTRVQDRPIAPAGEAPRTGKVKDSSDALPVVGSLSRWYEAYGDPEQSLVRSCQQTLVGTMGSMAVSRTLNKAGVPTGNAKYVSFLTDPHILLNSPSPKKLALQGIVEAPLIEEVLFRAIPSAAFNSFSSKSKTTSAAIPLAVATSGIFGYLHSGHGTEHRTLPLSQTVLGFTFWRQLRNNGLLHPVVSHTVNNALAIGVALPVYAKAQANVIADWEHNGGESDFTLVSEGAWKSRRIPPEGWMPKLDKWGRLVTQ